jgi:hypothetical protein
MFISLFGEEPFFNLHVRGVRVLPNFTVLYVTVDLRNCGIFSKRDAEPRQGVRRGYQMAPTGDLQRASPI